MDVQHSSPRSQKPMERIFNNSYSAFRRLALALLYGCVAIVLCGCKGAWVWQEDYPKHRTMSFKCPRWNYDEAYDRLHHAWSTKQHEPIKIKK